MASFKSGLTVLLDILFGSNMFKLIAGFLRYIIMTRSCSKSVSLDHLVSLVAHYMSSYSVTVFIVMLFLHKWFV